jgi:hypothetical protein
MVGVYNGSVPVTDFNIGGAAVKEVYAGATKVWSAADSLVFVQFRDTLIGYIEEGAFPLLGEATPRDIMVNGVLQHCSYLYDSSAEFAAYIAVVGNIHGQQAQDITMIAQSNGAVLFAPGVGRTWFVEGADSWLELPEMFQQFVDGETYELYLS